MTEYLDLTTADRLARGQICVVQNNRRTPPPPFVQVGQVNPPVEDMARALRGQVGLFLLRYEHDDGCETLRSQRMDDCTCQAVDHRLLRFVAEGQAEQ